jgi:hypothetical protein
MITGKVVGDKELIKKLLKVGNEATKILRKELRPVAKTVATTTKPLIPKRTGMLRKSVAIKPVKKKRRYNVAFRVVLRMPKEGKFYGFAPNFGVRKGRGKQPALRFMHKGLMAANAELPKLKSNLLRGVEAYWRKGK